MAVISNQLRRCLMTLDIFLRVFPTFPVLVSDPQIGPIFFEVRKGPKRGYPMDSRWIPVQLRIKRDVIENHLPSRLPPGPSDRESILFSIPSMFMIFDG